jgi:hypothetical protein
MATLTRVYEASKPEAMHVVFIHGLGGDWPSPIVTDTSVGEWTSRTSVDISDLRENLQLAG